MWSCGLRLCCFLEPTTQRIQRWKKFSFWKEKQLFIVAEETKTKVPRVKNQINLFRD